MIQAPKSFSGTSGVIRFDKPASEVLDTVMKEGLEHHYGIAYGDIAAAIYVLDTPGPTPPTLRHCPFERVERTYFPADEELELTDPVVLRGW